MNEEQIKDRLIEGGIVKTSGGKKIHLVPTPVGRRLVTRASGPRGGWVHCSNLEIVGAKDRMKVAFKIIKDGIVMRSFTSHSVRGARQVLRSYPGAQLVYWHGGAVK